MLDAIELGTFMRLRSLVAQVVGASSLSLGLCALAVPPEAGGAARPPAAEGRPAAPLLPAVQQEVQPGPPGDEAEMATLDAVSDACWKELRDKRIYFVHRSVGDDLVKGMEDAMRRRSTIGLRVVGYDAARRDSARGQRQERRERERERERGGGVEDEGSAESRRVPPDAFAEPGFVHADAGYHHAETKIDEFEELLLSEEGARIDVAILKLCYKDFGRSTDTATLLQHYAQAVESIRHARPDLVIVHCTVPLREPERGFRRAVKDAVGVGGDGANAARGRFNEALRKRFHDEPMLDLARLESVRPDGSEATVVVQGASWPALAKEYSEDGAHLNARGRLRLGVGMLATLGATCRRPGAPEAASASGERLGPPGD